MRLLVDLKTHLASVPEIIQVQKTPAGPVVVNGKYAIPMPLDVEFPVDAQDYVLDGGGLLDGSDVTSKGFAHLLASFPQYGHLYFNPLLTDEHVGELNWDGIFNDHTDPLDPKVFKARFQSGREAGLTDSGQMPTHTALLSLNNAATPPRPGLIVTDAISIGPYTLDCDNVEAGAKEFMVFWQLQGFVVSHDVAGHTLGATAGKNEPALRTLQEIDPEPSGFSAYISTNGGSTWGRARWMTPVTFCDPTVSLMVAFRNDGTVKRYLASFAVLF